MKKQGQELAASHPVPLAFKPKDTYAPHSNLINKYFSIMEDGKG